MAQRERTIATLLEHRASAILRLGDAALARRAMRAAVDGGFRVIEFTLTTPDALALIAEFAGEADAVVGAGTVLTPDEVRAVADAGARFVVSPVCDPAVIETARALDLATIPGTFTATEMWTAHRAGADFVKLFPAPADVAAYVAALRGPLPALRIVPTNGVDAGNAAAVLAAGAAAVGFVKPLFDPAAVAAGDFGAIEERARQLLAAVAAAPRREGA